MKKKLISHAGQFSLRFFFFSCLLLHIPAIYLFIFFVRKCQGTPHIILQATQAFSIQITAQSDKVLSNDNIQFTFSK